MEINKELEGKKITKADINGFGITLKFDDGTTFYYDATDSGYSSYELEESNPLWYAREERADPEKIKVEYHE